MRLKRQHQAPPRESAPGSGQGGGHLDRMVAVVVNHGGLPAAGQRGLAVTLKTPPNAPELGQRLLHRGIGYIELHRNRDGRQRIEHIVLARQVKHHRQIGQGHAVAPLDGKVHLPLRVPQLQGPHLRLLAQAVAGNWARELVSDLAHGRIVGAQDGGAVKRHAVQKIDEGRFEATQVMTIRLHMVGIDVGDYRHHGQQIEKRSIGLVGFDHDVVARTELGVGTRAVETPADDKGRVKPALGQHAGHQRGGGGLAVGAGNGNAALEPHQLGQHRGARHHRNMPRPRCQHLGVVRLDGRRGDHRIDRIEVASGMAHKSADAQTGEPAQGGAVGQVGA